MAKVKEIWADIPEYSRYECSSWGNIRNKKTGRILIPQKASQNGKYRQVNLVADEVTKAGKYIQRCLYVHRIVAQLFVPNPLGYSSINHMNGIGHCNHYFNLCWTSHKDNIRHGIMMRYWLNPRKAK